MTCPTCKKLGKRLSDEVNKYFCFQMDICLALGQPTDGVPFDEAVKKLREENERLRVDEQNPELKAFKERIAGLAQKAIKVDSAWDKGDVIRDILYLCLGLPLEEELVRGEGEGQ